MGGTEEEDVGGFGVGGIDGLGVGVVEGVEISGTVLGGVVDGCWEEAEVSNWGIGEEIGTETEGGVGVDWEGTC